ncbi:MAG: AMP-binding protein [Clostridiales bacterium]|jgi:acetyl-CoA synthetase|nr:AMP-binding protein [Clostridiales bacterium]
MPIYEEFTGRGRDGYASYEDLYENYRLSYPDSFNFAYDVLDRLGREKPDKPAMVWVGNDGGERRFTFREMADASGRTANFLKSLGIKKGDYVLLVLKRSYNFWFAMMGLCKIGAIPIPATHMLTAKDYIYRCNAGGVKAAIITGDGDCAERFDEALPECPTVELKLTTNGGAERLGGGWIDFDGGSAAAASVFPRLAGDEDTAAADIMLMMFSSGTTGYPKMVAQDYTYALGHLMTGVFWHRCADGGLHFTISDTGWGKSLWGKLYGQWLAESAVFVYDFDKFDGANILRVIEKYKITTFCCPPTMYRMILASGPEKYDLSSLTHCTSAGEALNPDTFIKWKELTGLEIHEGFGQTETTLCCSILYPYTKPAIGSMGRATPGYRLYVADEDGSESTAGATGEVVIRAGRADKPAGLFSLYNRNPEGTNAQWHDGVYHTGDTAYADENGYIWYVGRNDDMIKSSGYRIGPFEVESVLVEHPAVKEAAVTGYPDKKRGQLVKATIVLNAGYEPSGELVKELQTFVKRSTAPYKYPRVIEFADELPKTISSKLMRSLIKKRDLEKYESESGE